MGIEMKWAGANHPACCIQATALGCLPYAPNDIHNTTNAN